MQATVGIDFMAKNITVGSTTLRLQLWDTAGQERFRSLIPSYLKDATVILIVFDITSNCATTQTGRASRT
jgi:small GTP-binding protein